MTQKDLKEDISCPFSSKIISEDCYFFKTICIFLNGLKRKENKASQMILKKKIETKNPIYIYTKLVAENTYNLRGFWAVNNTL